MPSHDAISDLFSALGPRKFAECFIGWVNGGCPKGRQRCGGHRRQDGKGAASKGNKFPLNIVTAFCTKDRLCLGQQAVDEKGNEITALPQLLKLLAIENCIVTLDAMGCQKNIAEKIRGKKADYIL